MDKPADILFIAGPTASGKSELAVQLAKMINAEIVSADAYQVYQGLEILTAAPMAGHVDGVPYHMTGIIPVSQEWNASDHYHMASGIIKQIHRRSKIAIVVGGSGLYLKFLTHGISNAPPGDAGLRESFASRTLEDLYAELKMRDPDGAALTSPSNRRYVERNLEIVITGGKPLSYWRSNWQREPSGPGWVMDWQVDQLDERIARRAEIMMQQGVLQEVSGLGECSVTAERTLGLLQARACLKGEIGMAEFAGQLSLVTRQYAKRQRTWLRREKWLNKLKVDSFCSFYELATQVKEFCNL